MSDDQDTRRIGDLTVTIDRTLCVGFGDCVDEAEAFVLDREGVAIFHHADRCSRDQLLQTCASCPVDALTVIDAHGTQIVPEE